MTHHQPPLPSADNSATHNVKDIAALGAVGLAIQAKATGRAKPGGPFSGAPIDDPLWVPVTAGNIIVLHYLLPIIYAVTILPVLVIGAIPFVGATIVIQLVFHTLPLTLVVGAATFLLYVRWIVWRVAIRKVFVKICETLF